MNAPNLSDFDAYQRATRRTAGSFESDMDALKAWALGIAGEGGEVADLIKKVAYHGKPLDVVKLKKELGDVLWYVARCADEVGLSLFEVAEANLAKLRERYPEGFSHAASAARVDEEGSA